MADDLRNLAGRIKGLETKQAARQATQLDNSSLDIADADPIVLGTAVADAQEATTFTIPGLQEALDLNDQRLQETAEAVAAAMDAADAATEAGLAAGDEANQAADEALERAQEALDAAAAISGDIYTGRPPTADDAGRPGQGWYVWDSNYHITAYYVYQDETGWVQTVLDDGAFGNIDAGSIVTGYLGAERLAAGSLTAAVLAADTLTSREIGAEAVLARNIKAASITAAQIAAATITGGNIAANTITAGNIKAGTITANEIAAGTITATQINLDSLNGKTITGAIYRSAATGTRVEISGTTLAVYSKNQTAPVGGIQATEDGAFSQIEIVNSYSSAGNAGIAITVPRNPFAGSYESSRLLGLTVNPGLRTLTIQCDTIITNYRANSPYPFLYAPQNGYTEVTGDLYRMGADKGTKVIFGEGGEISKPATVVVQADDFRLRNGKSITSDTGWITPNLNSGFSSSNGFAYRIIGNRVYWRGGVGYSNTSTQFPAGYTTVVSNLPDAAQPSQYFRAAIALYNGVTANLIISGGRMDIGITGTSANVVYLGGINYLND